MSPSMPFDVTPFRNVFGLLTLAVYSILFVLYSVMLSTSLVGRYHRDKPVPGIAPIVTKRKFELDGQGTVLIVIRWGIWR